MTAVGMFTIAMGLMGTFYCGMKCNGLDLCPNYAGSLMAVVNGVGAISGIITPYLISALTPDVSIFNCDKNKENRWRNIADSFYN